MSVFSEKITPAAKKAGLPPAALEVGVKSLDTAYDLSVEFNSRIQRVNEAKASDPNDPEVLDAKVANLAEQGHKDFAKDYERYQALIAEEEKILARMRENAKAHIQPPLSEDEQREMRKLINESKSTVETARASAISQAEMLDAILTATGNSFEGGIASLLPELDSLKGARGGRKSAGKSDGTLYATRANDVLVDGNSTAGAFGKPKANFAMAAELLSKEFGATEFPENKVTGEDLEEAFYKHLGVSYRDKDSIPETTEFEFTKDVARQGKSGVVSSPVTKKIQHIKWTQGSGKVPNAEKAEAAKSE